MEMPLLAAVAIQGHARAAMEAQPIGEPQLTQRSMMHCLFFKRLLVCLYIVLFFYLPLFSFISGVT